MQTLFKLLLVTGLLLMACSCATPDHVSGNYTDTIKLGFKALRARPDTTIKGDTGECIMIRQKTDSTLKFTYYWIPFKYWPSIPTVIKDSSRLEYYTFTIRNDSFKLVDWYTYWGKGINSKVKDEPAFGYPGLVFVNTYADKQNDSIRFYKYEEVNPGIDGDGAVLFSREYGLMARLSYQWGSGHLLILWQNKPVNPGYEKLFKDDLRKICSEEWTNEGRLLPGKDKKQVVW